MCSYNGLHNITTIPLPTQIYCVPLDELNAGMFYSISKFFDHVAKHFSQKNIWLYFTTYSGHIRSFYLILSIRDLVKCPLRRILRVIYWSEPWKLCAGLYALSKSKPCVQVLGEKSITSIHEDSIAWSCLECPWADEQNRAMLNSKLWLFSHAVLHFLH
jgi:hypothetical protein